MSIKNRNRFEAEFKVLLWEIQDLLKRYDVSEMASIIVDKDYISAFSHKDTDDGRLFDFSEFTNDEEEEE